MKNVYIYCEGYLEESFINETLSPYFWNIGIYVYPIICETKRTIEKKYKGGVSTYAKIKKELTALCRSHPNEVVTTMFDYYAMPANTPLIDHKAPDIYERIATIEQAITQDIGQSNCFFGLTLHEFEGLLFSCPETFALLADAPAVDALRGIRDEFPSPEHINNLRETAPSKRICAVLPNYAKVKDGAIISGAIGIDKMLSECRHFAAWIARIKAFPG